MLTNIFANNRKLHKFATTNSNFEKIDYFRHVSKYNEQVYQFSAKSGLYRSVKTVHTKQFAKNRKLLKYATYNSNLENKLLSDIHHRITYIIINFQQDRVSRSVKTVHTNLFANNRKLHKFATCN